MGSRLVPVGRCQYAETASEAALRPVGSDRARRAETVLEPFSWAGCGQDPWGDQNSREDLREHDGCYTTSWDATWAAFLVKRARPGTRLRAELIHATIL